MTTERTSIEAECTCTACGHRWRQDVDRETMTRCPVCHRTLTVQEVPDCLDERFDAVFDDGTTKKGTS